MTEPLVRLLAPAPIEWRVVRLVLTIPVLFVGWLLSMRFGAPLWFALSAIGAVGLALAAALHDDIETWVRPEGLAVRRRNMFRTQVQSIPSVEVKGIGIRPDWLPQRRPIGSFLWRVVIDTARHGRIRSSESATEKDALALEQRVRRTLGW
jgi:hypothetical protein